MLFSNFNVHRHLSDYDPNISAKDYTILALNTAIGIAAMSQISKVLNKNDDASNYLVSIPSDTSINLRHHILNNFLISS